jgi:hypothetical protein
VRFARLYLPPRTRQNSSTFSPTKSPILFELPVHSVYQDVLSPCKCLQRNASGVVILTGTPTRGGSNHSAIVNKNLHNLHNTAHRIAHNTPAHLDPPLPARSIPERVAGTQLRAEQVGLPSCASQFLHPARILGKSTSQTTLSPSLTSRDA